MQTSENATRNQYPLSSRKIIKKTIAGVLKWAIFLCALWIFISLVVAGNPSLSIFSYLPGALLSFTPIILIVVIVFESFYQRWYFATYFYELDTDHIVIRKGPITPLEITIPYERIQDVYVDQDLLDRMFGLYDVHLSSATMSSGMAAHIDGVMKDAAEGLRKQILDTVTSRISRKS